MDEKLTLSQLLIPLTLYDALESVPNLGTSLLSPSPLQFYMQRDKKIKLKTLYKFYSLF